MFRYTRRRVQALDETNVRRSVVLLGASIAPLVLTWLCGAVVGDRLNSADLRVLAWTVARARPDARQSIVHIADPEIAARTGVMVHELVHGMIGLGFSRDVPTAAAMQFCHNADNAQSIGYRPARGAYRRGMREAKLWQSSMDETAFERRVYLAIDSLLAVNTVQMQETPASYMASARLAALARGLRPNDCGCIVLTLSLDTPAWMADRSCRDSQYGHWVWSSMGTDLALGDETYLLRAHLDAADMVGMQRVLEARGGWDSVGAANSQETLRVTMARRDSLGFERILRLGTDTRWTVGEKDTLGLVNRSASWSFSGVAVRINLALPAGDQYGVQEVVEPYLRLVLSRLPYRLDEVEIGTFPRNQIVDSTVTIQWSHVIPQEALTYVKMENNEIRGALITLHTSMRYFPVLGQELLRTFGFWWVIPPDTSGHELPDILNRPGDAFRMPGYEYILPDTCTGPGFLDK